MANQRRKQGHHSASNTPWTMCIGGSNAVDDTRFHWTTERSLDRATIPVCHHLCGPLQQALVRAPTTQRHIRGNIGGQESIREVRGTAWCTDRTLPCRQRSFCGQFVACGRCTLQSKHFLLWRECTLAERDSRKEDSRSCGRNKNGFAGCEESVAQSNSHELMAVRPAACQRHSWSYPG